MATFRFTAGERHVFRRRPPIPVSRWCAENLVVKDGPYAGGRFRLDVNPYLAEIMDTWGQPGVEEVVVCGAPQTGKTLLMYGCLAYCVDRRPGPRMLAMPDDDTLDKVCKAKLLPLFKACPPVRSLLAKTTAGMIRFRDGSAIYLASAQSPSDRASISVQDLFLDEEALYRQVAGQGVPLIDFKERTNSYGRKSKVLRGSKPVGGEDCSICWAISKREEGGYNGVDELRRYEARCPSCMQYQVLTESGLVCPEKCDDPQEIKRRYLARYKCAHCGYLWTDHARNVAVAYGRWAADEPVERPRVIGYHLPAILSSTVSLSKILAAKIQAEASDSPEEKQAYANGFWAEPYRATEIRAEKDALLELREEGTRERIVPKDAVALTCGIDMQKRGFFYTVWGWAGNLSSWLVDYGRLRTWEDVGALVFETRYDREQGGTMPIWRAALDTGGTDTDPNMLTRTEEAYVFLREHAGREVLFGTKGLSRPRIQPVTFTVREKLPRSGRPIPGGVVLYLLDPGYFKSLFFGRLTHEARQPSRLYEMRQDASGSWVLAEHEELIKHLQAEQLVRGRDGRLSWVKVGRHNHYLDACALAHACADPVWFPSLQLTLQRQQEAAEESGPPPTPGMSSGPGPGSSSPGGFGGQRPSWRS